MSKSKGSRIDYVRSETNLFENESYDISIASSSMVDYHPQGSISNQSSPLMFFVRGDDVHYMELPETKLYLRCKITNSAGGDLPAIADKAVFNYGTVNNLLGSMFEKITVHINEVEVTQKSAYNQYRSYIENLLSYTRDHQKSQLEAAMFYRSKSEKDENDTAFTKRTDLVHQSNIF